MMVEDKLRAEAQLEQPADQEKEVRRITGVHDVEAARAVHLPRDPRRAEKSGGIFDRVTPGACPLYGQVIPVDVNAVDDLVPFLAALAGRADDGNPVTTFMQRGGFLPDASIKGAGQILHEDENPPWAVSRRFFESPRHRSLPSPNEICRWEQEALDPRPAHEIDQPGFAGIDLEVILQGGVVHRREYVSKLGAKFSRRKARMGAVLIPEAAAQTRRPIIGVPQELLGQRRILASEVADQP